MWKSELKIVETVISIKKVGKVLQCKFRSKHYSCVQLVGV